MGRESRPEILQDEINDINKSYWRYYLNELGEKNRRIEDLQRENKDLFNGYWEKYVIPNHGKLGKIDAATANTIIRDMTEYKIENEKEIKSLKSMMKHNRKLYDQLLAEKEALRVEKEALEPGYMHEADYREFTESENKIKKLQTH